MLARGTSRARLAGTAGCCGLLLPRVGAGEGARSRRCCSFSWVLGVSCESKRRGQEELRVFGVLPARWTSSKRDGARVFREAEAKKSMPENAGLNQPFPARNHLALPVLLVSLGPAEHPFVPGLCSCARPLNHGP